MAVSFIFTAVFAMSAFAQAPAAAPGKIGLVNVNAFGDETAGITKFKNALKSLEPEFKAINDELKTLQTKYTSLAEEIRVAQQPAPSGVPAKAPTNIAGKIEEAQNLEITIKRKQEDGKAKYERRYQTVVGPVFGDIVKALNEYAKKNGYAVILDGARLEQSELLLGFDDKYDVTKDFIVYYNARPAGTATTATPK
jgi:Skp family chaperone for outer membrane proteins